MISKRNKVLYTGKSKNLRERIYTHIHNSHHPGVKKAIQKGDIKEIKIFCCQTELDAIILERYFIQSKIYRGKFNIQFTFGQESTESRFDDEQEQFFILNKEKLKIEAREIRLREEKEKKEKYDRYILEQRFIMEEKIKEQTKRDNSIVQKLYELEKKKLMEEEEEKRIERENNCIKGKWLLSLEKKIIPIIQNGKFEDCKESLEQMCLEYYSYFYNEDPYGHISIPIDDLYEQIGLDFPKILSNLLYDRNFRKLFKKGDKKIRIDQYKKRISIPIFNQFHLYRTNDDMESEVLMSLYPKSLVKERECFIKKYVNSK